MKALALFSGGLDSTLAIKLVQKQKIEAIALHFMLPFQFREAGIKEAAKKLGVRLIIVRKDREYLKMLRKPRHGYGKNMNPCIDCKIFILKEAKKVAKRLGAKFIFTGEVLGERPMSQNPKALKTIAKESGVEILRPLSALLLPLTIPEKKGWVNRKKLLSIHGRSRKKQLKLAKKFKIKQFQTPGGGCLLTYKEYANKLRDLLKNKKMIKRADILLLKIGRHFRYANNKIIVGRNDNENKILLKNKQKTDYVFETDDFPGPITLLQGKKTSKAIKTAAALTARYSDAKGKRVAVKYGRKKPVKSITITPLKQQEINKLRV